MKKIKLGRNTYDVSETDFILDNGACYQLVTKEIRDGWYTYPPVMSKKLFSDLKKKRHIYTNEDLKKVAYNKYKTDCVTFWKFSKEFLELQ